MKTIDRREAICKPQEHVRCIEVSLKYSNGLKACAMDTSEVCAMSCTLFRFSKKINARYFLSPTVPDQKLVFKNDYILIGCSQ